ncbi:lambda exonuclease family protein [Dyella mobilis]|uniref:YqaJ viral recombinase family protein n=1 Tax=Dyella mobilis TaxID=1849582 RepID=A0ABS2KKA3_9GAMM|nr:lambda exonuclease family protein [Dyella mobilis]MBM7131595.1 YqaJ viral recombinase family protein [Dyella mobilis]GLQ96430.1 exonuclease [Dyella mobilis]
MEQNTQEWRDARAGKITASRMCDVMAFTAGDGVYKSGPRKGQQKEARSLKARTDYIGDIVAEILTGEPREQIRAKTLDWGHDVEAAARAAYEAETGIIVVCTGFVTHPIIPYVGCSPDGLIADCGQTQIKCPQNPANHIETLRNGMPEEHIPQVQGELYVTGRDWSDFVSYDPRMPEHLRLYHQRIDRDEEYIAKLADACNSLWVEVMEALKFLNERAA